MFSNVLLWEVTAMEHIGSVPAVCVGSSVFVSGKVGGKFVGRVVDDFYVVLS